MAYLLHCRTRIQSGTISNSDSQPDDYIGLRKTCPHCTDFYSDPYPDSDPQLLLYPFLGRISTSGLGFESVFANVNNLNGIKARYCRLVKSSFIKTIYLDIHSNFGCSVVQCILIGY